MIAIEQASVPGAQASFRRYVDRSSVRTNWIGSKPSHWGEVGVRHLFSIHNGATPSSGEPAYWDGEVTWVTPEDLGSLVGDTIYRTRRRLTSAGYVNSGTTMAPAGSIVVSTRAPIGHVAIAGVPLCSNQGCRILEPRRPLAGRYYYYHLVASRNQLRALGRGSTFTELSRDALAAVKLLNPPLDEQRAIAAFLDRETAQIDALIATKERLIALLQEKRTALISHAVTKGLDPTTPTRDSGIPWIGHIPAHWDRHKLGHLMRFVSGGTPSKDNASYWIGDIPWVSPKDMKADVLSDSEDHISDEAVHAASLELITPGAVLIVTRGMILAHTFPVGVAAVPLTINQDMKALVPRRPNVVSAYLRDLLKGTSSRILAMIEESGHGTKRLRTESLKAMEIFLPPLDEQLAIANYLEQQKSMFDGLINKIRLQLDVLGEHRTALISAAVTGKIDVRGEIE